MLLILVFYFGKEIPLPTQLIKDCNFKGFVYSMRSKEHGSRMASIAME